MAITNLNRSDYRPDIDGLRAIAILGVLVYHLYPSFLPGGFLGVDIFFVISGFLITRHLVTSFQNKNFSIWYFYDRRIRRILPALTVVVIITTFVLWFVLLPFPEFRRFSESIASVGLIAPNMYFWRVVGYFNESGSVPLLHTWSLGIEEQFYLLWPTILGLILKLKSTWLKGKIQLTVIILIALASLIYSQYLAVHSTQSAFYWLPSRAWELLAGSILGFNYQLLNRVNPKVSRLLSNIGLLTIVISFAVFNERMPLPGFLALIPIVATTVLIYSNCNNQELNSSFAIKILTSKIAIWIGLISYSLYLWHWPIIVGLRIVYDELTIAQSIAVIISSFVLAYLSWRFIEQPLRKVKASTKQVISVGALVLLSFFIFGIIGYLTGGYPNRLSEPQRTIALQFLPSPLSMCKYADGKYIGANQAESQSTFILVGDSHAQDLCPVLDAIGKEENISIQVYIHIGCFPLQLGDGQNECNFAFEKIEKIVNQSKENSNIRGVILASVWSELNLNSATSENDLNRSLQKLANYVPVVFIGDVPTYKSNITQCHLRKEMLNRYGLRVICDDLTLDRSVAETQQSKILETVESLSKVNNNLYLIDRIPLFCDQECRSMQGQTPLYSDSNHLTMAGVMKAKYLLQERLRLIVKNNQYKNAEN